MILVSDDIPCGASSDPRGDECWPAAGQTPTSLSHDRPCGGAPIRFGPDEDFLSTAAPKGVDRDFLSTAAPKGVDGDFLSTAGTRTLLPDRPCGGAPITPVWSRGDFGQWSITSITRKTEKIYYFLRKFFQGAPSHEFTSMTWSNFWSAQNF
jgi:hypothetical protein